MNISMIKVRIARIYLFTLCARTLESLQIKGAMRTNPYAIRVSATPATAATSATPLHADPAEQSEQTLLQLPTDISGDTTRRSQ